MKLPAKKGAREPAAVATPPPGRRRWYTTGQAARRLGYSRKTLYRWCVTKRIPAQQATDGGEWRISAEWVEQQLESMQAKVVRRKKK